MRKLRIFGILTALLCVGQTAAGQSSTTVVDVSLKRLSCAVSPRIVEAGSVGFRVVNRSGRSAAFSIDGQRVSVAAGRGKRLTVSLRPGRVAFSCTVGRRQVGGGFVRVTGAPQPVAEHRIGVRDVDGFGEFFDRTTGTKFVPRGNNYIRVAPQTDTFGRVQVYHSTFNIGAYDRARADAALARMAADGYNLVRVFLNNTCAVGCSTNTTGAISAQYAANLTDFLRKARAHGVFVLLTGEWLPSGATYDSIGAGIRRDWFDNINIVFLSPQGIQMSVRFWQDLIRELVRQQAPLDAIFAYSLWNEAHLAFDFPPFTLASGQVTTANGQSYDISSDAERSRMIDDAFVYYTDHVRAAIQEVDSSALVTIGFWTAPDIPAGAVIERSKADFVDVHPYPTGQLSFSETMYYYGIVAPTSKPVVMGEVGAFTFAYSSPSAAAAALVAWQRESCRYGIDGWLLWTWDTDEQPELWNALSSGGVIERALAPKDHPDPCA